MNCIQMECPCIATHIIFWPESKPVPACDEHTELAATTAKSLGIVIRVEDIDFGTEVKEE
jgi:hypothetical protein